MIVPISFCCVYIWKKICVVSTDMTFSIFSLVEIEPQIFMFCFLFPNSSFPTSDIDPRHSGLQEHQKRWGHNPWGWWNLREPAFHGICSVSVLQTPSAYSTCQKKCLTCTIWLGSCAHKRPNLVRMLEKMGSINVLQKICGICVVSFWFSLDRGWDHRKPSL